MAERNEEPVYVISIAARLCEMHPQTLRSYEKMGLVRPARTDSHNRLYSQRDIERVLQIQRLTRDLGVNLAGVEVILDLLDRMERMKAEMKAEMEAEIARLHQPRMIGPGR